MRYSLIFILACVAAFSCAGQDNTNVYFNDILVVAISDGARIDGEDLGVIKFTENGFKAKCTRFDAMSNLTFQCRKRGGNLMKLKTVKPPDVWSTCYRITAVAYKVPDPQKYVKEILWHGPRKLTFADFKDTPQASHPAEMAALTFGRFGYEVSRGKLQVFCKFHCYKSWIRQTHAGDAYTLAHEQAHFDITEIFARKLQKAFIEENITADNLQEANNIYVQLNAECKRFQQRYDDETAHGGNRERQREWLVAIYHELSELPEYNVD